MLAEVPRQILQPHAQFEEFTDARLAHVEASDAKLRFKRIRFVLVFEMADKTGQALESLDIEAKHFTHFTRS